MRVIIVLCLITLISADRFKYQFAEDDGAFYMGLLDTCYTFHPYQSIGNYYYMKVSSETKEVVYYTDNTCKYTEGAIQFNGNITVVDYTPKDLLNFILPAKGGVPLYFADEECHLLKDGKYTKVKKDKSKFKIIEYPTSECDDDDDDKFSQRLTCQGDSTSDQSLANEPDDARIKCGSYVTFVAAFIVALLLIL